MAIIAWPARILVDVVIDFGCCSGLSRDFFQSRLSAYATSPVSSGSLSFIAVICGGCLLNRFWFGCNAIFFEEVEDTVPHIPLILGLQHHMLFAPVAYKQSIFVLAC